MPIVTISRGSLSGGQLLAERLGARLNYKVLSREIIVEAAKKYGVSESELASGLDEPAGFWERFSHKKEHYLLAVQATLAQMLLPDGNGVYHGHAGQFLLKGLAGVLKLRILAPLDHRVRSAMIELDLTHEQALKHIETVDERRVRWVRQLYGGDWHDPGLYDLVINLEDMSVETAAELVVHLLSQPEYCPTAEHLQAFQDFALAARVRAELAFHSPFTEQELDVSVARGVVHLSGGPAFQSSRKEIVKFVRAVEGVKQITPDEGEEIGETLSETAAADREPLRKAKLPLEKMVVVRSKSAPADAVAKETASGEEVPTFPQGPSLRIMILDDEPIVGKRLHHVLTKHRFEVEVFENPTEALARLGEAQFDVVVTDFRMDEVDGIQILEHITAKCPNTRVILITGYATVNIAREALVKGAFDFIAKPFKPKDVLAAINKAALSLGHRAIDETNG